MSGEDRNHAVAHAATGLGEIQARRRNEGGEGGRGRRVVLDVHPETKEKRKRGEERMKEERGARWKNRVHLTSARVCSSHATMPCYCCVRSASMCMPMCGNVMHGISCHHHHDELFVCQCVLQPAIPVCVCLCVQRARQCRQQAGEHTPPKKKRGERVCARGGKGKQPAK